MIAMMTILMMVMSSTHYRFILHLIKEQKEAHNINNNKIKTAEDKTSKQRVRVVQSACDGEKARA